MNRKTLVLGSLVLPAVVMAATLWAQAPAANRAAIEKQIVANERAVNETFAKNDAKGFHSYVAADAVSVDPAGVSSVNTPDFDKMMASTKMSTWNIDGSKFYWINDTSVVHMYRWTGKGTFAGEPLPSPTWASTVWTNRGGKWLAVFHQETVAMTPPPAPAGKTAAPAGKK